jgi:hypothetical protein
MGDLRGASRLNDQSFRVSILGIGTSKDRCLDRSDPIPGSDPDRSAKLWIIAEPARDLTFFVLLLRGTVARIGPARIRLTPDSIETTPELRNTLRNEIW